MMRTAATARISNLAASCRKWIAKTLNAALLSVSVNGDPAPASRPRVGRYGVYYSAPYKSWQRMAADQLGNLKAEPTDQPIVGVVETVVKAPASGKTVLPRGDVDNFGKAPLDAITKAEKVWHDDSQVAALFLFKRYTKPGEEPGVHVHWAELGAE